MQVYHHCSIISIKRYYHKLNKIHAYTHVTTFSKRLGIPNDQDDLITNNLTIST